MFGDVVNGVEFGGDFFGEFGVFVFVWMVVFGLGCGCCGVVFVEFGFKVDVASEEVFDGGGKGEGFVGFFGFVEGDFGEFEFVDGYKIVVEVGLKLCVCFVEDECYL